MELSWQVLVVGPAARPGGVALLLIAFVLSAALLLLARAGAWMPLYNLVTALIGVPYLMFASYVISGALFPSAIGYLAVAWSAVVAPVGAGWLAGLAIGALARRLQR